LTLTFGLDQDRIATTIEVEWPSGAKQTFPDVAANQLVTIDEARGIVP
jgi:predicted NUDIX family NTP pyrophosphohydrolase